MKPEKGLRAIYSYSGRVRHNTTTDHGSWHSRVRRLPKPPPPVFFLSIPRAFTQAALQLALLVWLLVLVPLSAPTMRSRGHHCWTSALLSYKVLRAVSARSSQFNQFHSRAARSVYVLPDG